MKPPNGMYQAEAMIYLHANRLYHVLPSGTSGNLRRRAKSGLKKYVHMAKADLKNRLISVFSVEKVS